MPTAQPPCLQDNFHLHKTHAHTITHGLNRKPTLPQAVGDGCTPITMDIASDGQISSKSNVLSHKSSATSLSSELQTSPDNYRCLTRVKAKIVKTEKCLTKEMQAKLKLTVC